MSEYTEYQRNNLDNILHFNYGVELFPTTSHNPVIKKNTQAEALVKLKKLLRNNGFAFLAGKLQILCIYLIYLLIYK